MNRRALIGFLVLAALVGGTQALDESHLAALGERLVALQDAIAADTKYTRLTATPGYLWGGDVVNTYDPYQGPLIDSGGLYYADSPQTYQSYEPLYQVVKNDDGGSMPAGFVPLTSYSEYRVPGGQSLLYGAYDNLLVEYPSAYGTAYGSVYAPLAGASLDPYGNYYTGSSISYGSPHYQDTWYTRGLPGIGQALVPLIPPQYQPVGYGTGYGYTGYSITSAQLYPTSYYSNDYPQQQSSAAPTCSILLSPSDIRYGGSTVVSWVSRDATTASLNEFGAVPLSGSKTLSNQTVSRTIGLTVARGGRIGACYALLEVAPESLTRPNCIISAYPERIQRGQSASIAWLANNATSASLSGVGSVPREGGRTVSPAQTTQYVLTVGDGSRSSTCTATLHVL